MPCTVKYMSRVYIVNFVASYRESKSRFQKQDVFKHTLYTFYTYTCTINPYVHLYIQCDGLLHFIFITSKYLLYIQMYFTTLWNIPTCTLEYMYLVNATLYNKAAILLGVNIPL